MGNEISVDTERVIMDYNYMHHINDPLFGPCLLLKHKNSQLGFFLMAQLDFTNKRFYQQNLTQWQLRLKLRHQNIIQLEEVNCQVEERMLTTHYKICLFFQQVYSNMYQEFKTHIDNKKQINKVDKQELHKLQSIQTQQQQKLISAEESWYLLESLVKGLEFLERNNLHNGNIQLKHILLTKQKKYKIFDHTLVNNPPAYLQIVKSKWLTSGHTQGIYLAPEQMARLVMKDQEVNYDPVTADIFTLGMNILSLLNETTLDHCYDYHHKLYYADKLQHQIDIVADYYGDQMQFILQEMTNQDEDARPTYKEILECIEENKDNGLRTYIEHRESHQHQNHLGTSRIKKLNLKGNQSRLLQSSRMIREGKMEISQIIDDLQPSNLKKQEAQSQQQMLNNSNFSQFSMFKETKHVKEKYGDGSRYEGDKKDDKRHGRGSWWDNEGYCYEGQWRDDKRTGQGTYYSPQQIVIYQGDWVDDKWNGFGVQHNPKAQPSRVDYYDMATLGEAWLKYEGDFRQGDRQGYGTLHFANNEKFMGNFKEGKVHGKGTFYLRDGSVVNGNWEHNRLV